MASPPGWLANIDDIDRVSSIRLKQGVFLIFSEGWIWVRGALPDREIRFGRAALDLLEGWLPGRKVETDAGGGGHRVPTVIQISFAPFAWRTGVTCPRQIAGAEYLEAMVRPGVVLPGSDRGRPVSWLTDPSRRVSTRHPNWSHPVAPSPFLLVPFAVHWFEVAWLVGRWFTGVRGGRCREVPASLCARSRGGGLR